MARKYTRDNRGRFASGGSGATARGGRLRTAAGNKRKTQTMKAARMSGVVGKPRGPASKPETKTPATSKLRPGELMNANAFPRNAIARSALERRTNQFGTNAAANVATAQRLLKAQGVASVSAIRKPGSPAAAWAQPDRGAVTLNASNKHWKSPAKSARQNRKTGQLSTSDPRGTLFHEAAHLKFKQQDNFMGGPQGPHGRIARRVSKYAQRNPKEFVSEVYAGIKTGRKYDREVMRTFRGYAGLPAKPPARRRSRLK